MEDPDISLPSPAKFVLSQKGTNLLQDVNNFTYRIHKKNLLKKTTTYHCTRKISAKCPAFVTLCQETNMIVKFHHAHVHTYSILRETAKQEEKMTQAAASVGRVSTVEILSKIRTNLERSTHSEATSSIRKSRTIAKAINWEKRKVLGHSSTIPKSAKDIKENLPEKFQVTSTGGIFLRHCDYVDDHKKNFMMIFMSDHGAWVMGKSTMIFVNGTFDTPRSRLAKSTLSWDRWDRISVQFHARSHCCRTRRLPRTPRCGPSSLPMSSSRTACRTWSCRILRRASWTHCHRCSLMRRCVRHTNSSLLENVKYCLIRVWTFNLKKINTFIVFHITLILNKIEVLL